MSAVLQIDPIVRPMTQADLPVIAALDAQCYPFPWTLGNFADSLHSGYRCCVYEYNQTIIGYVVLMKVIEEAHLLNITIAPDSQGQGLGRKLMQHVIARVRQDCVQWLWLEVRPSNLIARKLYESMDFEFVAVRKNYYPAVDGREDAVILRLAVNEHA